MGEDLTSSSILSCYFSIGAYSKAIGLESPDGF
jgi:hypothetical protein